MNVATRLKKSEIDYWGKVKRHGGAGNTSLWRDYCDRINTDLFSDWLKESNPDGKVLKTDLHEEVTGKGLYHFLHAKKNFIAGIDIGFTPVRQAVDLHPGLKGICADARNLPFQDATFDAVVSTSTLDHFKVEREIYAGLSEICRVLKPDGALLLTLDNPLNPLVWIRNKMPFDILNRLGIVPYFVGVTLRPAAIEHYLIRLGMRIVRRNAVMHSPRVVAVFISALAERVLNFKAQQGLLRFFLAFEALASWPTRYRTGYFLAIQAIKNFSGVR
jgi:SAM-dependent methyltransferase